MAELSEAERKIHRRLAAMNDLGRFPSMRSLEDDLDSSEFMAERFDGEVRPAIGRMEQKGWVRKFRPGDGDYPETKPGQSRKVIRLGALTPDGAA